MVIKHVVSGIIIKNSEPRSYLLVVSPLDYGEFSGYYYPPAGHVKNGEDEVSVLKEKIKKEVGLEINNAKKIADAEGDIEGYKVSWYLCDTDNYELTVDNKRVQNAGFFTQKEMKSMKIWPATKKVFEKYIFNNNFK